MRTKKSKAFIRVATKATIARNLPLTFTYRKQRVVSYVSLRGRPSSYTYMLCALDISHRRVLTSNPMAHIYAHTCTRVREDGEKNEREKETITNTHPCVVACPH